MANPARLGPAAVAIPPAELFEAEVLDNASAEGQEVRCVRPNVDPGSATDPMPWNPVARADGFHFPKRGDRALLAYPEKGRGRPVIVQFFPAPDAAPDVPL